jgi:MFS family permease
MTDLNLICYESYYIALVGALSFFSFSIGSALFTNLIDKYGRKSVLIYSSLVTPIGILALIAFANSLTVIYVVMFVMGLTYNTRASVAYLYGTEFIEKDKKMVFG